MNRDDLCFLPATELAKLVRTKKLSPVEITQAILARIERVNPWLNAFCTLTADLALEQARKAEKAVMRKQARLGPLHGVPFTVKDLLYTKGVRTMRGSKMYQHFVPQEDHPTVTRLLAAGGIMLGKTTTPEFGWKGVTDSPLSGITRNPWNLEKTPGGSSGGASAAVAAGLGPLAIGTDGGGSIRIPASFAGIVGHKPSFGRVPGYPPSPFYHLAHTGPMTRTVADAALMLRVMAGPDDRDRLSLEAPPEDYPALLKRGIKGKRVAWSPNLGFAKVDPEVAAVTARAARAFAQLGCKVEEVDPGFGDATEHFMTFWTSGIAGMLRDSMAQWEDQLDPGLVGQVKQGLTLSAADYVQAQIWRHGYWDRVRALFETHDLLLTPTVAVLPFKVGLVHPDEEKVKDQKNWIPWSPFTYPFNLTHLPACTVPAGFSKAGLPVGLQIVGRRFADTTVLQAAAAYEKVRPWAAKRPKL